MRWNRLVMVIVLAAFCFGGTFTCKGSTHDDKDDNVVIVTNK